MAWAKLRLAPDEVLALSFIGLMFVWGGGGTPAPLAELVCQLLAAACCVAWLWQREKQAEPIPRRIWWVLALAVVVPVIQLIPLPPLLWQALPGRDVLRDALGLIGAADRWWPISIAPQVTLGSVLIMLPPAVALIMVTQLGWAARNRLLLLLALLGVFSVTIGAAQLASAGTGALQFYDSGDAGALFGFQANHNAQADILLITLLAFCAACVNIKPLGWARMLAAALLALLLLLGVILTGSRAGIALIPVALGWAAAMWFGRVRMAFTRRQLWLAGAGLTSVLLIGLALTRSSAIARVLARFDFTAEARPDLWRDSWFAAQQYWPVGSGLGTFPHAIHPAERLEAIGPTLPNRAHNELLELLIEGGLPLLACWLAIMALVGWCSWQGLRQTGARLHSLFATGSMSIILLHSAVDYPFRSVALATLAAVAAGLVLTSQTAPIRRHADRANDHS